MTPDRNCFESFSSVRGNVVLADKNQVEYTGVGSVRLSCRLPSGDISVVLLRRVLFFQVYGSLCTVGIVLSR
jgi:hypothetical protein